jgi:hypothetical protein
MKPKPPPEDHRRALLRVLSASIARTDPAAAEWLSHEKERFVLVSWTSLLYTQPSSIDEDLPGVEALLAAPYPTTEDKREIELPQRRIQRYRQLIGDAFPQLTSIIASPALKQTLAEVHRYLEDQDGIAGVIRKMVRDAMLAAWRDNRRVLLVGHSLGSVIAYDCLWELSRSRGHAEKIDVFLTLGSPIATRFIRKALLGAHLEGAVRYPDNIQRWLNVSARGELVALHPKIAPFFSEMSDLGLLHSLEDCTGIYNHFHGPNGLDVHKSYGYLNHQDVAGPIAQWIAAERSGDSCVPQ